MSQDKHPLFGELEKCLSEARKGDARSAYAVDEIAERLREIGFEDHDFDKDTLAQIDSVSPSKKAAKRGLK